MVEGGWQHERGRIAGLSRSRADDDPELVAARSNLAAYRLAEHVRKVIDTGRLTREQRLQVAQILTGGQLSVLLWALAIACLLLNSTPGERSLRASIASLTSWGKTGDRAGRTSPARAAFTEKFLAEAGGDPVRAEHLRRAHYRRMALRSAQSRRAKAGRSLTRLQKAALSRGGGDGTA